MIMFRKMGLAILAMTVGMASMTHALVVIPTTTTTSTRWRTSSSAMASTPPPFTRHHHGHHPAARSPPLTTMRLRTWMNDDNDDDDDGTASRRLRKRDYLVRKWGNRLRSSSSNSSSSSKAGSRLRFMSLRAAKDDNNNDKDKEASSSSSSDNEASSPLSTAWTRLVQTWEAFLAKLPAPLVNLVKSFFLQLFALRWQFVSFTAGAFLTIAAILVPIYSQVETLSKPVTLFETILGDLEQAYVDPVDTDKLFETGMAAMLRSLDPYTEYESAQDATDLSESIDGKYAGVGLVITGNPSPAKASGSSINSNKILPPAAKEDAQNLKESSGGNGGSGLDTPKLQDGDISSSNAGVQQNNVAQDDEEDEVDDEDMDDFQRQQLVELSKARKNGIRVVNAFEGYAFDYGLRVGDKLVAIDDTVITENTSVEQVRNKLRGEPGTLVSIAIEREGVQGVQTITMPRQVVRIDDVKLATLVGNPADGIGYIQLTGFASDAGREVRQAILALQRAAEDASGGERSLQGLILDLRGNPGGLLTSAVDVASLIVPKGSDIVSARGRGFPGILYRSRVDPLLDANTKLAVLVNGNTASAAEIVSGAIQDLDVGIIVGGDRTFGKGLVQNVEELPFNSALKFTVAKYYTPSGRCIQGINYKEGSGKGEEESRYQAKKVSEKDKNTYFTRLGRAVRDGGGIEVDYKVEAPKASALEVTLLRSGLLADFAAEWSRKHELTTNFAVDDETYKSFQTFVMEKQKSGDVKLEALYGKPLSDLKMALKSSGYKGSEKVLENLQHSIVQDIQRDFNRYSNDIKEDISQSILARYLPESMLIERGLKTDKQVQAAIKLVSNGNQFDKLLAAGSGKDNRLASSSDMIASKHLPSDTGERLSGYVKW